MSRTPRGEPVTHHRLVGDPDIIHATVARHLAEAGQTYTANRRAVVAALIDARGPMTLPALLVSDSSLAQSSAYRCLAVLEEAGVVTRLTPGSDHAFFELAEEITGHHHHLVCEACGVVIDIVFPPEIEDQIDRGLTEVSAGIGFAPRRHTIDIFGRCSRCT
ncbi:MAG: hypothetical protein CSA55_00810 [Ilumatobacter coccineus]|uniref:Fur family transcriptional regulator n=1 Tax=Ilumatobacter coccineus TaxID=467094 RepID=A0A2G6KFI9_9ACTN|nr:MAG: hypothetical protein CSA55_00810 [Ilumatobacter coccineus]